MYNFKAKNETTGEEELDDSSALFIARLVVDQIDFLATILYRLSNKEDAHSQSRPRDGYSLGFDAAIAEERRFYQEVAAKLQELLEHNPESFNTDPADDRQMRFKVSYIK